jgi:hypothetical protein
LAVWSDSVVSGDIRIVPAPAKMARKSFQALDRIGLNACSGNYLRPAA